MSLATHSHPNIAPCLGQRRMSILKGDLELLFEFAEFGSLDQLLGIPSAHRKALVQEPAYLAMVAHDRAGSRSSARARPHSPPRLRADMC